METFTVLENIFIEVLYVLPKLTEDIEEFIISLSYFMLYLNHLYLLRF